MAESRAHRITPTPRPDGCDLNIEGFVTDLLTDLLDLLGRDAGLMDQLCAIIDGEPARPDPFTPERELPTEALVADLVDRLPTAIRQHRPAVAALHAALGRMLDGQQGAARPALLPVLPTQQDRRVS